MNVSTVVGKEVQSTRYPTKATGLNTIGTKVVQHPAPTTSIEVTNFVDVSVNNCQTRTVKYVSRVCSDITTPMAVVGGTNCAADTGPTNVAVKQQSPSSGLG